MTVDEAAILARLATGKVVLEIGTGLGVSSRAIASTARRLDTVDNDEWVHRVVWPGLAKLPNVRPMKAIPDGETYQLIFVDGNHHVDSVRADMLAVSEVRAPGCLIVMHDWSLSGVRDGAHATGFRLVEDYGTACKMVRVEPIDEK